MDLTLLQTEIGRREWEREWERERKKKERERERLRERKREKKREIEDEDKDISWVFLQTSPPPFNPGFYDHTSCSQYPTWYSILSP